MKIDSADHSASATLEVVDIEADHVPGLAISVAVDTGVFKGAIKEVWLELHRLDAFLEEIDRLDRERKGKVVLESTLSGAFWLCIESSDLLGHLALSISVTEQMSTEAGVANHVSVTFPVDPTSFPDVVREFRRLLEVAK